MTWETQIILRTKFHLISCITAPLPRNWSFVTIAYQKLIILPDSALDENATKNFPNPEF